METLPSGRTEPILVHAVLAPPVVAVLYPLASVEVCATDELYIGDLRGFELRAGVELCVDEPSFV